MQRWVWVWVALALLVPSSASAAEIVWSWPPHLADGAEPEETAHALVEASNISFDAVIVAGASESTTFRESEKRVAVEVSGPEGLGGRWTATVHEVWDDMAPPTEVNALRDGTQAHAVNASTKPVFRGLEVPMYWRPTLLRVADIGVEMILARDTMPAHSDANETAATLRALLQLPDRPGTVTQTWARDAQLESGAGTGPDSPGDVRDGGREDAHVVDPSPRIWVDCETCRAYVWLPDDRLTYLERLYWYEDPRGDVVWLEAGAFVDQGRTDLLSIEERDARVQAYADGEGLAPDWDELRNLEVDGDNMRLYWELGFEYVDSAPGYTVEGRRVAQLDAVDGTWSVTWDAGPYATPVPIWDPESHRGPAAAGAIVAFLGYVLVFRRS